MLVNQQYGIIRSSDKNLEKYHFGDYLLCKILTVGDKEWLLTTQGQGYGILSVPALQEEILKASE